MAEQVGSEIPRLNFGATTKTARLEYRRGKWNS